MDVDYKMLFERHKVPQKQRETARRQNPQISEELFCLSIAAELRQLPPREQCMIKYEIQEVLFKYQMAKFCSRMNLFNPRINNLKMEFLSSRSCEMQEANTRTQLRL